MRYAKKKHNVGEGIVSNCRSLALCADVTHVRSVFHWFEISGLGLYMGSLAQESKSVQIYLFYLLVYHK